MSSDKAFLRKASVAVVALIILAAMVVPRFMPRPVQEARGRITHIDPSTGVISVEVIDPANGTKREVSGGVPADCAITIDGKPATFTDLRVDDSIRARARMEKADRGPDGKRKERLTAERIEVTRPLGGGP